MKKVCSYLAALAMTLGLLTCGASAAEIQPHSSKYLTTYMLSLYETETDGEIRLDYAVVGTGRMSLIGIYNIWIYTAGGEEVDHIDGSVESGLIGINTSAVAGSFYYDGLEPGQEYYMVVEVFAADITGSDYRTDTTGTARA